MNRQIKNSPRGINRLTPEKLERLYHHVSEPERRGAGYMLGLGSISPGLFISLTDTTVPPITGKASKPSLAAAVLKLVGRGSFEQRLLIHQYEIAMTGHLFTRESEERGRILRAYPSLASCLTAKASERPSATPEERCEMGAIGQARQATMQNEHAANDA